MPNMLTPRRGILALVAVLALVLIVHSFTTSTKVTLLSEDGKAVRPYPPSLVRQKHNQHSLQGMSSKPLRDRLEYYFPLDLESKFPAYIWQTWTSNPSSGEFDEQLREKEASWTIKNPGFVHEVIIDEAAERLISYLYASIPEVIEAYSVMPVPVLKADFFRYLILLARGGIYSDIDTEALKPAADWLPESIDQSSVGLVAGIEADPDRADWAEWYARRIQFCQWTIQAKPGHPVLRDIVATITEDALLMHRKGELRKGHAPKTKSIMEFTGPGVWTDAIFSYFNNKDYFDFSARGDHGNVSASDFFNLQSQKKLGDVLILPITSFSPGVRQMGAKDTDDELAFVHHDFKGSWKSKSERTQDD